MKVGTTIPNHWGVANVHDVVELAEQAERMHYASVWTMDHLLNVGRVRERLDDRPYWHPMGILTAVAMRTSRIELGTSVMVLPYHDPVGLAKYSATLDALSHGRVILGVGVGALVEEFEALGVPIKRRGALTDEYIDVIKDLWLNPDPSYQGGRFNFDNLKFSPVSTRTPHTPIWIGGFSQAALKRTARVGDGWHPNRIPAADYAKCVADLEAYAEHSGRTLADITLSLRMDLNPSTPVTAASVREFIDKIQPYRDAGLAHLVVAFTSGDVPRIHDWMSAIAEEAQLENGLMRYR